MEFANRTILVVDDDPAILEMISDGLIDNQFEVVTASSPDEVPAKIKHKNIAFALLDFDLGYKNKTGIQLGIELADRIPDLVVVIMTGYHNIKYALEAMRNYQFHYMIKPFRIDQIISLFERAIRELQLRKENETLKQEIAMLKNEIAELRAILKDIRPEEASFSVAAKERELRKKIKNQQALNSYQRHKDAPPIKD